MTTATDMAGSSRRTILSRWPLHLVIAIILILWIVPTIGTLVNSFRSETAIRFEGWWTAFNPPLEFTLENYRHVLTRQGMGDSFINSLILTIPATIIPIAVASFAAYAFAWMKFPFRNTLFVIVVGLLVVPLQMTFVPLQILFRDSGLAGSFLAVWLAHTGFGLPFALFLLRNYMGSLPGAVFESAAIDGASEMTAFFRLALPMSVPAIASLAIFQFLWVWNDLLVALIFLGPNIPNHPMTVKLASLVNSLGGEWHFLTAAAFIQMALPVLVFLFLQRYFASGLLAGAVKG
ncbi:MAG TPA: carbohydrate ABC transporter permease [Acidimicrobiia bacterium]